MEACEKRGEFRLWTARVDGLLAGGIMWWIAPHPNFANSGKRAMDGGHYLAPQFRGKGLIGLRMWRAVIPELKAMGVTFINAHENSEMPLPAFFRRLGFEPFAVHYGMEI
jgi:hypothetical protein